MSLPQEILDLLTVPLYIERFRNKDEWGNPVYGPSERVMSLLTTHKRQRAGISAGFQNMISRPIVTTINALVDYGNYSPYDRARLQDLRSSVAVVDVETYYEEDGTPMFQQFILEEIKT